jgi:hypothetical protein
MLQVISVSGEQLCGAISGAKSPFIGRILNGGRESILPVQSLMRRGARF